MGWREVLEDRVRLGGIKESTLAVYVSSAELFNDWLSARGSSFDAVINGDSQTASNLVGEYVNDYLRSAEVGYRRSVMKHLCAIFRLCGRSLLDMPKTV